MTGRLLLLVLAWLLVPGLALGQSREAQSSDPAATTWTGFYWYPPGANQRPVPFVFKMEVAQGRVTGRISEPNTFGDPAAQYLYADVEGDIQRDVLRFTKTYDGTGGQSHDVLYEGYFVDGGAVVVGYWRINDTVGGFMIRRSPLTGMIGDKDRDHAAWQGGDGADHRWQPASLEGACRKRTSDDPACGSVDVCPVAVPGVRAGRWSAGGGIAGGTVRPET